jgi:hypothetical protein
VSIFIHFLAILVIRMISSLEALESIDYRCEDGRFPVSASCVVISNPRSLASSETGVNPGRRSWKSTYLIELEVRKPWVVSISQSQKSKELRIHNLIQNLTISNPSVKAVSSNTSPGWTVRSWGDDRGFLK